MPTTVRSVYATRMRWLLPLLLALLIVAIVAIFVFGNKIKSLASSPTSTPTVQPTAVKVVVTATARAQTPLVVTATPAPGAAAQTSATAGPAATGQTGSGGAPTATPGGQGISTPLPHATPCPTQTGLKLCMITRSQSQVQYIQSRADQGDPKYTYYLNPVLVVEKNMGYYGFTQGMSLVSPTQATPVPTAFTSQDGRPVVNVKIQFQGKFYQVSLAQTGTQGPKGIWNVVTILPLQS